MCSVEPSRELVVRWRNGEQDAAEELLRRYWECLVRQLEPKIGPRFRAKFDAEDIALSAIHSFLHRTGDGQYEVDHTGGLWQLLKRIAESKLQHWIEHHTAKKRSVLREADLDSAASLERACFENASETATELMAHLDDILKCFDPLEQKMIRLAIDGCSVSEIMRQIDRKRSAVDSVLKRFRQRVQRRLKEQDPPED